MDFLFNQKKHKKLDILKDSLAIVIITSIISLLNLIISYSTIWFRDYAIIYEGSYRLLIGQTPYIDFSMPAGPMVFYIQYLFNLIFGPTILAMSMHVIILSIILSIIFYFYLRKNLNIIFSIIFSIAFYISYYGLLAYPWYNQTAFFFTFIAIFLILMNKFKKQRLMLLMISLLLILSFLSKQDIGIYSFILLGLSLLLSKKVSKKRLVIYYIIPFVILLTILLFVLNSTNAYNVSGSLFYKLREMIDPKYIFRIAMHPYPYLTILSLWLLLKEKDQKIKNVYSIILTITILIILSSSSSGLSHQTLLTGIPLVIFLFYIVLLKQYNIKNNIRIIHILMFFLLLINIFNHHYYMYDGKSENVAESYLRGIDLILFEQQNNTFDYKPKIGKGCLSDARLESSKNLEDLNNIRSIIESSNKNLLNLMEFTFLYCDYNIEPPKNIPLWFHYGLTFKNNDVLIDYISREKPSIILVPLSYGQFNPNQDLIISMKKLGYNQVYETSNIGIMKKVIVMKRFSIN